MPSFKPSDLEIVKRLCRALPGYFGGLAGSDFGIDTNEAENDLIFFGCYSIWVHEVAIEHPSILTPRIEHKRVWSVGVEIQVHERDLPPTTDLLEIGHETSLVRALRLAYMAEAGGHFDNIAQAVLMPEFNANEEQG